MLSANDRTVARFYSVPSYVPDWGLREFRVMVRCLVTNRIVRGDYPRQLCEIASEELGVPYALPFNRARWAIQAALGALEVGGGDEVVVPSYVCESVLQPIANLGAQPVYADTGPDLHLSVDTVERAITTRTKAVIVAHLYGNAAPIAAIENLLAGSGVALIDDAAQSLGARSDGRPVGTFGTCGMVGCGPGKSLAGPAGGLLLTRERELYDRIASNPPRNESAATVFRRVLAFWIWFRLRRYTLGFKPISDALLAASKSSDAQPRWMSNLDAALVLEQHGKWHRNADLRRGVGEEILRVLGDAEHFCISDLSPSGIALRIVLILPEAGPTANEVVAFLHRAGIEARRGYEPLHGTADTAGESLPVTETLSERTVLLPVTSSLMRRRPRQALEKLAAWILTGATQVSGGNPDAGFHRDPS